MNMPAPEGAPKILFVDDELRVLEALRTGLRRQRNTWSFTFALGGASATRHLQEGKYDIVVTDMNMPSVDGLAVLRFAKINAPHTKRVVLTGDDQSHELVVGSGLADIMLTKPCPKEKLIAAIEKLTAASKAA